MTTMESKCGSRTLRRIALLRRPNLDLRRQGAVDRALVGDLQQARPLAGIERAFEPDCPLDAVDHPVLALAGRAVGGVNPAMAEPDRDPVERQRLAPGIEPQG